MNHNTKMIETVMWFRVARARRSEQERMSSETLARLGWRRNEKGKLVRSVSDKRFRRWLRLAVRKAEKIRWNKKRRRKHQ